MVLSLNMGVIEYFLRYESYYSHGIDHPLTVQVEQGLFVGLWHNLLQTELLVDLVCKV